MHNGCLHAMGTLYESQLYNAVAVQYEVQKGYCAPTTPTNTTSSVQYRHGLWQLAATI